MSVDFSCTKVFEQRYGTFNDLRIKKALNALNDEGKRIFHLIPALLHYDHPLLPAYINVSKGVFVPHGIRGFEVSPIQQKYLDKLVTTRNYVAFLARDESILALYCMGSTSSIGQGPKSDIDYWVCVSSHMSEDRERLLVKKCEELKKFAANSKIEINFFIVHDDKFKDSITSNKRPDLADDESCGSAQKLFLLDEFYRSAIYLGGQKLVWMLVPKEKEPQYEKYVAELFETKAIKKDEWIDLGSVGPIPSNEYYGSALWLLYKGIDSPFKAAMKILLMEAYSSEFPNTELLSVTMREYMQQHDDDSLELDSYYVVYKKIANYLKKNKDYEREKLLRMCFYLKISQGLKVIEDYNLRADRNNFIRGLLAEWKWTEKDRRFIDDNFRWHINDVRRIYDLLFNSMMQSYRQLLKFCMRNKITDAIKFQDIRLLSRKLYAAFDSFPGKIKIYNLNIGNFASEANLSFVEVRNSQVCRNGWYIYASPLDDFALIRKRPIAFFQELGSAVVESCFNGMISDKTSIWVHSQNKQITEERIKSFVRDLKVAFPSVKAHVSNEALLNHERVIRTAVFANLERDPAYEMMQDPNYDLESDISLGNGFNLGNIFSAGSKKRSLVGSLILVNQTSWNEIIVTSYLETDTEHCIYSFIRDFGRFYRKKDRIDNPIQFYQYSRQLEVYIRGGMVDLLDRLRNGIQDPERGLFPVQIAGSSYNVSFTSKGIFCTLSGNEIMEEPDDVPPAVLNNITYGMHQYYFMKKTNGLYDIFESDEHRELKIYRDYSGDVESIVVDINNHYAKILDSEDDKHTRYRQYFNLPQYFVVDSTGENLRTFNGSNDMQPDDQLENNTLEET